MPGRGPLKPCGLVWSWLGKCYDDWLWLRCRDAGLCHQRRTGTLFSEPGGHVSDPIEHKNARLKALRDGVRWPVRALLELVLDHG